jgi:hypothetical protein
LGRGQYESNLELHSNEESSVTRHPETSDKRCICVLLLRKIIDGEVPSEVLAALLVDVAEVRVAVAQVSSEARSSASMSSKTAFSVGLLFFLVIGILLRVQ